MGLIIVGKATVVAEPSCSLVIIARLLGSGFHSPYEILARIFTVLDYVGSLIHLTLSDTITVYCQSMPIDQHYSSQVRLD